ncbi:hypothetical protein F5Y13DRAFT_154987 [Hypoxylon sp. FL1857]|nr:hypothetical protein F5Y13DRAFT_154987 [Hypoxylon sp. FL1857]
MNMSIVYKGQGALPSGAYPSSLDGDQDEVDLLGFPGLGSANLLGPLTPPENVPTPKADDNRPSRSGSVPRPPRVVTKNQDGKLYCSFPGCKETNKVFDRPCEWNKHMDKHYRPYKCTVPGCEKLDGFTYGGGLSRHEREVHGKHGGPKNALYCPHGNCKRHDGKVFTRMENLNEHLRRVHTPNELPTATSSAPNDDLDDDDDDEDDDDDNDLFRRGPPKKGDNKRKSDNDLRGDNKRLRTENGRLKAHIEAQNRQAAAMMQEMNHLRAEARANKNVSAGPSVSPAA